MSTNTINHLSDGNTGRRGGGRRQARRTRTAAGSAAAATATAVAASQGAAPRRWVGGKAAGADNKCAMVIW